MCRVIERHPPATALVAHCVVLSPGGLGLAGPLPALQARGLPLCSVASARSWPCLSSLLPSPSPAAAAMGTTRKSLALQATAGAPGKVERVLGKQGCRGLESVPPPVSTDSCLSMPGPHCQPLLRGRNSHPHVSRQSWLPLEIRQLGELWWGRLLVSHSHLGKN